MPTEILMPSLSANMTEAKLASWLKAEGDAVKRGDAICEIETDKATLEVEADADGVLGKIAVAVGTERVKVGDVLGWLLGAGEDAASLPSGAAKLADPLPVPSPVVVAASSNLAAAASVPTGRVLASPLAKRVAAAAGIDLSGMRGSGPNGRILRGDVEAAKGHASAAAPAASPVPAAASPFEPAFEEIPNSSMRKIIARRLTEAKSTIPHFYLSIDCELDALLKVRADLNGRSDAYKLSVNDFVVRAVALALKKVPAANAAWGEEAIKRYTDIDISVAVATPSGLITPIVHHADHKGLAEISNEMKSLAAKARDNKLKPEEFQGGGFTISNLGMFGVKDFAAIINPPQGCILAVGAGEQRPVVKAGALGIATVMTCTLSVDHRVVDGAVGAQFLAAFKTLIEDPLSMLL